MKRLLLTLFIVASLILPIQGNADITKFGGFLPCTSDNGTLCTTSRYISTPGVTFSTSATFSFLTSGYLPKAGTSGALGNSVIYQDSSANIGLGTATFGTSAAKAIGIPSGTAPTTSPADAAQVWVADHNGQAGYARLHSRPENVTYTPASPLALLSEVEIMSNPKAMSQGIELISATTGAGLSVADNANIDNDTNNFAIRWKGALADYTPSGGHYLVYKRGTGTIGYLLRVEIDGTVTVNFRNGADERNYTSTVATGLTDYSYADIVASITRETASTAGSVVFYVDGIQLGSAVSITAGTPLSIANDGILYISGRDSSVIRYSSKTTNCTVFNRALTAAEVLDLYRNGPATKHFDQTGASPASQTAQTSGTLVVGKEYTIDDWITDDDFTNVGGANVDGTTFVATGTTPTKWTNSSSLRRTGMTLWLPSEGIQRDAWKDASGNGLNASYPASGYSFLRPIKTDNAEGLLSVTTVSFAADADTTLYTVPAGKRLVLTKAIVIAGADAGSTDIKIGQDGAEGDWVDTTQCDNLDAANDVIILQPVPAATSVKSKSYAAGTVIQMNVANHAGGATNTVYLFGFLY